METVKPEAASPSYSAPVPKLGLKGSLLAVAKSNAKRGIDVIFSVKGAILRAAGIIDFPLPPNSRLRRTSSLTIRHYYESGLTTVLPILTAARLFGVKLEEDAQVLDFGCGVARQILQLTRAYPNVHAFACDVVAENVQHIQRAFPTVKGYVNNFDPPLIYPDNTFDLVYSVSTFSHFSPDDARLWLAELRRVTKPNGLLCLTLNSYGSLKRIHKNGEHLDYTDDRLKADGWWYDVDEAGWLKRRAEATVSSYGAFTIGETRPTGNMYFTPEYARTFMESSGLEVLGHAPAIIDRMQDLIVLRKPAV
jgi:SAM-dependent methyltransferase